MDPAVENKEILVRSIRAEDGGVLISGARFGHRQRRGTCPECSIRSLPPNPRASAWGYLINRSIIEAHGGEIWAEWSDGPGLTVPFTLPAGGE
jgi:hypothetical protein